MSGKIYETIISIGGQLKPSVQKSVDGVNKSLGGLDKQALISKAKMLAVGAAVAASAYKATKALYDTGVEFAKAYKNIRIGTGATGAALDDLKNSFRNVYKDVPSDMASVSTAIADYNTRLGISGTVLEDVSRKALLLSHNLGGGDIATVVEKSSQAFQAWNVSADDMAGKLDYFFKVSQSTGMSVNDISANMQANAISLRTLGYNFDQAAALTGQMQKAGLDVNAVFASMKKAIANCSKEGKDAGAEFTKYYARIKEAGSATEAAGIAAELYGNKQGPIMASAIRDGKIDVAALTQELQNNRENIDDLAFSTMAMGDRLSVVKHKAQVAFEPMAMKLLEIIYKILPYLEQALLCIVPVITSMCSSASEFASLISENWGVIAPIVSGITVSLVAYKVAQTLANFSVAEGVAKLTAHNLALGIQTVTTNIATAATTAFGAALAFVTSPLGLAVIAIGLLVAAGVALYQNWDTVCEYAGYLGDFVSGVWNNITQGVCALGETIKSVFVSAFSALGGIIKAPINGVISLINSAISALNSISVTIPDFIPGIGGKKFGVHVPLIPMLATGGFTDGVSIAGEAGREAVISFAAAYRSQNIGYLAEAASMLGIGSDAFATSKFTSALSGFTGNDLAGAGSYVDLGGITYAPNISINGGSEASRGDIMRMLRSHSDELMDMIDEMMRDKETMRYGNRGAF